MADATTAVRRRSGRPKAPDFQYLGADERQEYREVSLMGSPTADEIIVGPLSGFYDTGGYLYSRYETRLTHPNWRSFSDPDRVIYRSYITDIARHSDQIVKGTAQLLSGGFLDHVDAAWRDVLADFSALRYHEAGASRVWQLAQTMAGSDTVHFCAVEEAGNRMLAAHALNHHFLNLAEALEGWNDDDAGSKWMEDPAFSGIRAFVEHTLVLRDWGEIVVADGLVGTILYQMPVLRCFGINAGANTDPVTPLVVSALTGLAERRLRWSTAVVEMALEVEENRPVIAEWLETWGRRARTALESFAPMYGRPSRPALSAGEEQALAQRLFEDAVRRLGLTPPALG